MNATRKSKPAAIGELSVKYNKLAEWNFRVPTIDGHKNIVVEVRLDGSKDGLILRATASNCMEPIEDSNIESLRARVESALTHTHLADIVWEDWLEVQVSGFGRDNEGHHDSESLSLSVRPVKYGLHPDTQEPYVIYSNGYPGPVKKRPIMFQGKELYMGGDGQLSYIPATPENVAAMEDVRRRLRILRSRLLDVMNQDNVQHTLNDLSERLPLLENKLAA